MTIDSDAQRILYLIDSVRAEGSQQSLLLIARELSKSGFEMRVGSLHGPDGLAQEFERIGVPVVAPDAPRSRRAMFHFASGLIDRFQPDLVHTTLYDADVLGRVAARRRGVPVVTSLVNTSYGPEHRADPAVQSWKLLIAQGLDALTARCAVRMHAVSTEVADTMARRLAYPRARIDVVPRGRDAESLGTRTPERRRESRAALGVSEDQPLVLAVARQEHQKGLDVLVESFALLTPEIPGIRLVIAGRSGSQTAVIEALIVEHGLEERIELLGARDDVGDLLVAADVFALPSRREGFPGAVVEAMALETPIVASDLPQVREAVGATGLLVPVDAPRALAEAIKNTFRESLATARRVDAARTRFLEHLTIDVITARMVDFYDRAVSDCRTRGGMGGRTAR